MIRGHPREAYRTFIAFAAFGMLLGGWAALVPQVQSDLGASKGALGLALLCIGLGSLPAMLLVGPVVDRRGPSVMPWALGALAVGAILPALAGSIWMLAAALVAVGAGSGAVDVSINAGASDIEARTGARIMQLAHGLFSAGVLVGAIATGLARQAGAGRLVILTGLAGVLLAAALLNRDQPARRRGGEDVRRRFRLRRHVILLGIVCGAAFLTEGGIENWSAIFMEQELDASPFVSALGPASYAFAMVVGRFSGQWVTGRVPDRQLLGGGALVSLAGLLVAAAAHGVPIAMAGVLPGWGRCLCRSAGCVQRRRPNRRRERAGKLGGDGDDDRLHGVARRPGADGWNCRAPRLAGGLRRPRRRHGGARSHGSPSPPQPDSMSPGTGPGRDARCITARGASSTFRPRRPER